MTRYALTIIAIAALLTCSAAMGKSIEDRKWLRVQTDNFTIFSTFSRAETRNLLTRLEILHAMFFGAAGEQAMSRVPTTIFAFDDQKDFRALGYDPDRIGGLFIAGLRRNVVLVRDQWRGAEYNTIIHEYVHYLLHNTSRFPFPSWYQEGYAEYIGNSELKRNSFDIGKADRGRIMTLESYRWLPWEKVIDSSHLPTLDHKGRLLFYAQAWLLVHFLYSQPDGEERMTQSMRNYGLLRRDGAGEIDAFEQAFGLSMDALAKTMRRYKSRAQYQYARFPVDVILGEYRRTESAVSQAEIAAELGSMLVELQHLRGKTDDEQLREARRLFETAASDPATIARAEMGIGQVLALSGQVEEAESWVISGASLAGNDYHVQLDATRYYIDRGLDEGGSWLRNAEPYLRVAARLDNSNPEFAYLVGLYRLAQGNSDGAIEALESAARMAPADERTRMVLAQVYAGSGDKARALAYARDLLVFATDSPSLQATILRLIESIEANGHQFTPEESK